MRRFGLTGGIATGKSSVATILRNDFNATVLDADQIARDIVAPGQPALDALVAHFGDGVLLDNGSLNRALLGEKVMAKPEEREALNQITHPRIFEAIHSALTDCEKRGEHAAFVEAALMVETGSYRMYDALIVVDCSPTIQLARLMHRNDMDEATAKQWIESQMPLSEKRAVADWIIENNGSQEELSQSVHACWQSLTERDQYLTKE